MIALIAYDKINRDGTDNSEAGLDMHHPVNNREVPQRLEIEKYKQLLKTYHTTVFISVKVERGGGHSLFLLLRLVAKQ